MVEWRIAEVPVSYPEAVTEMEARVAAIRAGTAAELVWLLEHPPLYTAGTSAQPEDLLEPARFPVYPSGRGVNSPITVLASGWLMSCSIWRGAVPMSGVLSAPWKHG